MWYDYTEPQAVVSKKRWKDAFKELKEQVKRKEKTSCEVSGKDSYDVSYHKKLQQINYMVDRNNEYTKVIKENDTTYMDRNYWQAMMKRSSAVRMRVSSQRSKDMHTP